MVYIYTQNIPKRNKSYEDSEPLESKTKLGPML